jgi:hypothetical protein
MSKIELWFPVAIYLEEDVLSKEENDKLKEHCLSIYDKIPTGGSEWVGGTYTSHASHNLNDDPECQSLLDKVNYHIHQFARAHNCEETYKNNYSWLNVATGSSWQEFHAHNGNVFSAVYYVSAPEGSGRIVFEDPKEPDMCPIKTKENRNQLRYSRTGYTPETGTLIIFRSYLRHLVEPGTNTEPRISIAMNYN